MGQLTIADSYVTAVIPLCVLIISSEDIPQVNTLQ